VKRFGAFGAFVDRHAIAITIWTAGVFLLMVAVVPSSIFAVGSGEVGVIWSRFGGGTRTDRVYREGTHIKWPWDIITIYNVRTQTDTHTYQALSSEGVQVTAEVTYRYQVQVADAGILHKEVGPDYLNVVVRPEVGAALRSAIGSFTAETLYSNRRDEIQDRIESIIEAWSNDGRIGGVAVVRVITLQDVLLREVILPPALRAAIERKMIENELSQEFVFRLQRERLEAERKRIEAAGIRDFQQIVGGNLTEQYLRWRGIDATLHLAQSPGSRLVIIGGRDGLPVILNPSGGPEPAGTPAPATPPEPGLVPGPRIGSPSILPSQPLGPAPQLPLPIITPRDDQPRP
jgi:regulator of protease activity HflC (stomatin/prohibitin superfamily)